jgi:molybdopterin converting factor small subunit
MATKPAKKANGTITVKLAALTRPIESKNIKRGTTLDQFLTANGLTYSSNIRVNAQVAGREYKLKTGDIICVVTQVSGGSR